MVDNYLYLVIRYEDIQRRTGGGWEHGINTNKCVGGGGGGGVVSLHHDLTIHLLSTSGSVQFCSSSHRVCVLL